MRDDQLANLLRSLDRNDEPDPAFADDLFRRLSSTAVARARGRSRGPFLLLAAALLVVAMGAVAVLGSEPTQLPDRSRNQLPVPDSSASPGSTPTIPTPSASPRPTPTASPAPPAGFATDTVVRTTVRNLTIREAPGTGAKEIGLLPEGEPAIVVDGPRTLDGRDWYLLSGLGLPVDSGCGFPTELQTCPMWIGWAASGDGSTGWLERTEVTCPILSAGDSLAAAQHLVPAICYGSDPITVRGWWGNLPAGTGEGATCEHVPAVVMWIGCDVGQNNLQASASDSYYANRILLMALPPGFSLPARGQWLEVTGHYNDPAAQGCTFGNDPSGKFPEWSILYCRGEFVVDSARVIAAPA